MASFLVVCPTHRDRRELERFPQHRFTYHDYASDALEQLSIGRGVEPPGDALVEVEQLVGRFANARLDGVVSTDDYPGSALAAIVARRLGLPALEPAVDLLCQHKYYARVAQRGAVPQATPRFAMMSAEAPAGIALPVFIKPIKSFFSVGAFRVDNAELMDAFLQRATLCEDFFAPLRTLFEEHVGRPFGRGRVLVEEALDGAQATLEALAFDGRVETVGIVDSVMYPGTRSFQRFEFPSSLPARVQDRMSQIAALLATRIGLDHGFFNIEFMYSAQRDSIHVIEINPRLASQFADLYEKVRGIDTYAALLDLAVGRRPRLTRGVGRHRMAASCVLRRFTDARVERVPTFGQIRDLQERWPDIRVEVLATQGLRLSEELQDGESYRYAIVGIGADNRQRILRILEECRQRLPFGFVEQEPLAADAAGAVGPDAG